MKLLTFRAESGAPRPGAALPGGYVADLSVVGRDIGVPVGTVAELLGLGERDRQPLSERLDDLGEDPTAGIDGGWIVAERDVQLLPPTGSRPFVLACGGMFASHLEEMGLPPVPPERPDGYVVNPNILIGGGQPIVLPESAPGQVDWEGELCVVFGRRTHNVTAEHAMDHVAGYTIFNDVSVRDAVPGLLGADNPGAATRAYADNVRFKAFPTFGPLGPYVTTRDELPDIEKSRLITRVNGTVFQDDLIGNLLLSIAEVIATVTTIHTFDVGDVMTLGTPGGVGFACEPQVFLAPGDVVEISVDGIGTLRNPVAAPVTVEV